ncbi:adenylate kinase [Paenibacillus ginsengarvi]|uniref:Adenylate kinase n=1 Tax=Paenibacillus ginsengarvi TaxID=400777 RepID=A0A3B0BUK9_9BACL|nr:adenylate kinase [Paenibacillus ginsengarvi]RKN76068.1 adenylate kinase [Paenibacillus ginsengarvi]
MLYVIGGASRGGKTTAAKRLATEAEISYFSLDYLMMGIANGIPELGVYPTEGDLKTALRMWPIVDPLMTAMVENGIDYTIEGVQLVPRFVAEFERKHAGMVRSCFLGVAELDVEESAETMKRYSAQTENDGLAELDGSELIVELKRIKTDSIRIKEECAAYRLAYYESSADFHKAIDSAIAYLLRKS